MSWPGLSGHVAAAAAAAAAAGKVYIKDVDVDVYCLLLHVHHFGWWTTHRLAAHQILKKG